VNGSDQGIFSEFITDLNTTKSKPYLRGILHVMLSCVLPIIYWFIGSDNFTMEVIILCCGASGMYHRLAPYIGKRYIPTFQLMDYMGSCTSILAYASLLFERHDNIVWIDRMPLVTATFLITEFILFHYHYHVRQLKELNRMLTHILCLVFTLLTAIIYADYRSLWFLLMCSLYFVAFYVFATIDSNDQEHPVWSRHETFHLILLFAFIVHLYISMK